MPVVDASVVVDWIVPNADPGLPVVAVLSRLAADDAELLAPRLLIEEVSNALLTGVRRERWSGAAADAAQGLLRRLPVRLLDEPRDLDRAWDLARRYDNHPIYDLVYVALAERRRTQLITADSRLRDTLADSTGSWPPSSFSAEGREGRLPPPTSRSRKARLRPCGGWLTAASSQSAKYRASTTAPRCQRLSAGSARTSGQPGRNTRRRQPECGETTFQSLWSDRRPTARRRRALRDRQRHATHGDSRQPR